MPKRLIRPCKNCGWRQYYRKTLGTWRCDRCGMISGGGGLDEKDKDLEVDAD